MERRDTGHHARRARASSPRASLGGQRNSMLLPSPEAGHPGPATRTRSSARRPAATEPAAQPAARNRPPREVRVCTKVTHVVGINTQTQTLTAMVRFEASWIDQELVEVAKRVLGLRWMEVKDKPQTGFVINRGLSDALKTRTEFSKEELDNFKVNGLSLDRHSNLYIKVDDKVFGTGVDYLQIDKKISDHDRLVIHGDECKQALFTPRLRLKNLIEKKDEEFWYSFYSSSGPPIICLGWKLTGIFQEVMDLHHFPFDVQELGIRLESGRPMDDRRNGVILVKNQNNGYRSICDTNDFVQVSEYSLFDRLQCQEGRTDPLLSQTSKEYAKLTVNIRVKRRSGYWWLNVILPLFIVTSCSFSSYAVAPDELADRCSITITSLLAVVGFKYIVSGKLPDINYPTLIDYYVLLCFVVEFLVVSLQVLSSLGVIEEPVYEYQISETVLRAAPQNKTACSSESSFSGGISSESVTSSGPAVRTIKISMHLVWFCSLWLALHMLAILCVPALRWYRRQQEALWKSPKDILWVGPLNFRRTGEGTADVVAGAVREAVLTKMIGDSDEAVPELEVMLWEAQEAAECIKNFGDVEPYAGKYSFAVVRVVSANGATNAGRIAGTKWRQNPGGPFMESTKVELLNPAWLALSQRRPTHTENRM